MHGFEKNKLKRNLVGFILILYFDEDHRSFMIIFGFWKNIGSLYILYVYRWFCISGLTTMQSLCCRIFVQSKRVILIER